MMGAFRNIFDFGQIDKIDDFQDLGVFGNIVYFDQIDKIYDFKDFGDCWGISSISGIVGDCWELVKNNRGGSFLGISSILTKLTK